MPHRETGPRQFNARCRVADWFSDACDKPSGHCCLTIGRRRAVVETRFLRLSGLIAWLTWLFVHVYYLIGFKNRLFVLMQWAWSYATFRRGARLIVGKRWRSSQPDGADVRSESLP